MQTRSDTDRTDVAGGKPGKSSWKLLLKVVISLVVLGFVFHTTGIEKTWGELSTANLWYVPVGVLVYLASQGVSAYRWQFLARALGFHLSWKQFYEYYLIGMYFNLFLPGAIGGDVGRMVMLAKNCGRKKREALLTLLAERGVGLVALMFLTTLIGLLPVATPVPISIRMTLAGMSLVGVIGFIALRLMPVEAWVERFPRLALLVQARVYWADGPLLLKSVALSLGVHGCMILIQVLIAQALGLSVPVLYLALVYGLVSLISVMPVAFNGLGVREGAYQFLLVKEGIPPETALAFALYWFVISTLTSLLGGLVLLRERDKPFSAADMATAEAPE